MEKEDLLGLKKLIQDYGAKEALKVFRLALSECADDYSDLGLHERAKEAVEVAELLSSVHN